MQDAQLMLSFNKVCRSSAKEQRFFLKAEEISLGLLEDYFVLLCVGFVSLPDLAVHLNVLNCQLHGKGQLVFDIGIKIKSFQSMWKEF